MSNTKGDNFDDEEIIIDDDLDVQVNSKPNPKQNINNIAIDEVLIDVELPLDEEAKRKLQKRDLIDVNEQYDVELTPHEENIPITSEIFKEEKFVDEIQIKFPKDVINENKSKTIPLKKQTIVEEPPKQPETSKEEFYDVEEEISPPVSNLNNDLAVTDEIDKSTIAVNIEEPVKQKEEVVIEDEIEIEPEIKIKIEDEGTKSDIDLDEHMEHKEESKIDTTNVPINEESKKNDVDYNLTDLDEKIENKEFISRHDVIFSEGTGLDTYKPSKFPKNKKSDEEIVKRKNNIAMMFMIIISTVVIISSYFIFSNYKPPNAFKTNIPQEAMEMLTEEYFFITSIEEFLIEINENVEKERILIDNYVSGTAIKEDTIKELNIVLKTKENLKVLYDKITPIEMNVIETKKLSDKIFQNTISTTTDVISKINNSESKAKIVENFNSHVDTNNSNIYMYNQYVQSVFRRYGISVTINGDKFVLDTSWLKDNK